MGFPSVACVSLGCALNPAYYFLNSPLVKVLSVNLLNVPSAQTLTDRLSHSYYG